MQNANSFVWLLIAFALWAGRESKAADSAAANPFVGSSNTHPKDIALIYDDWSQQDWEPKIIPVTEQMIVDTARVFKRWRETYDLPFDTYLIDATWLDRTRKYDGFDPANFPAGPDKALRSIREAGMKLGLWYSNLNAQILPKPEAWRASLNGPGTGYVISHGPYLEGLRDAWEKAYSQWGLRVIKFDFAGLDQHLKNDPEAGRRTVLNTQFFRKLLLDFKRRHPDVLFLLYNGYDYGGVIGSTLQDPLAAQAISPEWADYCDWCYSGDTVPADWPALRLRRGTEFYNDHQVRRWYWAGFPLDKIDDVGCYIGNGRSWFELGPKDFRSGWLLMLMRGGRKAMLYGDPALLKEADVQWMAAVYHRANAMVRQGARVELIGGWPALGQPYGYRLSKEGDGWLVLVNPKWSSHAFSVATAGAIRQVACLASDTGQAPPLKVRPSRIDVEVGPNQVVLLGLGAEAARPLPDPILTDPQWPKDLKPLPVASTARPGGRMAYTVKAMPGRDVTWLLRFEQNGSRFRWRPKDPNQTIGDALSLAATGCKTVEQYHDRPMWAGMSYWVVTQRGITGLPEVSITLPKEKIAIEAEAYLNE